MTPPTNVRDIVTGAGSVGEPLDRVDGRLKVTGGARYAAEYPVPNVAHAAIVTSTIAVGRIAAVDTQRGRAGAWRAPRAHAPEHAQSCRCRSRAASSRRRSR